MIRFIDLRYQGTQARFAFWDTVYSHFETYCHTQAWSTWEDFAQDYTGGLGALETAPFPQIRDGLERRQIQCPPWVFAPPTDAELDFREDASDEERTQCVPGAIRDQLYRAADRFAHAYALGHPVLPFEELIVAATAAAA